MLNRDGWWWSERQVQRLKHDPYLIFGHVPQPARKLLSGEAFAHVFHPCRLSVRPLLSEHLIAGHR